MNELIIEKVRQYEFIYNQHLRNYRDQNMRHEAWEEIGKELKIPASKVKEMWAKLRNCYSNALKRRKGKSGDAKKKITPWKYEQEMSFLKPYLDTRQTESNLVHEDSEETEHPQIEHTEQISQFDHGNDPESDDNVEDEPETFTPLVAYMPKKNTEESKFKHKKRTPAEEMVQIMKQNAELRKTKALTKQADLDDCDMFYLSMSKVAKTLPEMDQAILRMEVCKIVSEAQIKYFHSSSQSVSHTTSSSTRSCGFPFSPTTDNTRSYTTTPTLTPLHTSSTLSSSCSFPVSPSPTSTQVSNLNSDHDEERSQDFSSASMWRY